MLGYRLKEKGGPVEAPDRPLVEAWALVGFDDPSRSELLENLDRLFLLGHPVDCSTAHAFT